MDYGGNIRNAIIEHLRTYSAYDLPAICERLQIPCNNELDPMNSKATYLKSGINKLNDKDLIALVKAIVCDDDCPEFVENVDRYLQEQLFEITTITRRKVINWIAEQNDLEGNIRIVDFLNRVWDLKKMPSIYHMVNREEDILKHMVKNDDLSYKELMEDVLKVIYVSDQTFKKFIETLVYPDVRDIDRQQEYVLQLNQILKNDGYILMPTNYISGNSIYTLNKHVRGVNGTVKNIIFAGIGGKPDIVLEDSLSNSIEVIDNGVDCLVYNQPISANGLKWRELVTWWSNQDNYSEEMADKFFDRMLKSMDSAPEKNFMWVYYQCFVKERNMPDIPALIPQVYCHYDPKSAKMRNGTVYVHQRMDFLILFSERERVVVEIDGKQHYSDESVIEVLDNGGAKNKVYCIANSQKYAEMVEDDRKLKLYGYNVFRFGGYEFMNSQHPKQKIIDFFENLFELYHVNV